MVEGRHLREVIVVRAVRGESAGGDTLWERDGGFIERTNRNVSRF